MSFSSRGVLGWATGRLLQPKWTGICFQRRKATVGSTVTGAPRLKTFQELPGVGFWSFVYWFLLRGYILHTHELQIIYKKLYGPIWKFAVGREKSVSIASPEIMEKMMRQEGKYPMRCDMAEWKEHRNLRDLAYGPLTEEGERWYHLRQVLNKRLLKPSEAVLYADAINEVVSDLMGHLKNEREKSPCGVVVRDVANQLYRFALEGVSYILFETRIGCLQKQIPAKTQDFINSIGLMFKNFVFVNTLPMWTREVLPFWNRYLKSWDTIFAFGQKLIDKRMEEITAQLEEGEKPKGEYLTYLLSSGKVTIKEVSGSVAELLMAGVDTTSNTLAWTLYHLAKDTELQSTLFQEVVSVVPKEQIPTTEDLVKMPLLKAVIKETLRLYPVVPINSRVAVKDVIIEGYHFPKGGTPVYSQRHAKCITLDHAQKCDSFGTPEYTLLSCFSQFLFLHSHEG